MPNAQPAASRRRLVRRRVQALGCARQATGSVGCVGRAPSEMPSLAIRALVCGESCSRFGAQFLGGAERLTLARVPDLRLAVPSPVRRVQCELAVGSSSPGHSASLVWLVGFNGPPSAKPEHPASPGTRSDRNAPLKPSRAQEVKPQAGLSARVARNPGKYETDTSPS